MLEKIKKDLDAGGSAYDHVWDLIEKLEEAARILKQQNPDLSREQQVIDDFLKSLETSDE